MESDRVSVSIRKARLRAGLTQKEVAEALNKSQTSVAAWETGRSQPDAKTIIALCKLFHVSSDYLLGLAEFRNNNDKAVFDALLGNNVDHLPEDAIDSFSRFRHELTYLSNLLSDLDIDLLPCAIQSFTTVLHIYIDISKSFGSFKKSHTLYQHIQHLCAGFDSLSDKTKDNISSDQVSLQEFVNEISQFSRTINNSSPQDFVAEIMPKVQFASDVVAKFALFLCVELDKIVQDTEEQSNESQ